MITRATSAFVVVFAVTPTWAGGPEGQLVFRVEGLRCPLVKGIGCGAMLHPVLSELDTIPGVEKSFANRTGTMLSFTIVPAADRSHVVEELSRSLTKGDHKPIELQGHELKRALANEEWRDASRIGELSAIEFHTFALHKVTSFARKEKLNKETTAKLVQMAERQWRELAKGAENANRPSDWRERCQKALPLFLGQAKQLLTTEQLERFARSLSQPCSDEDRPQAPASR
jgi:hypothetical protein